MPLTSNSITIIIITNTIIDLFLSKLLVPFKSAQIMTQLKMLPSPLLITLAAI